MRFLLSAQTVRASSFPRPCCLLQLAGPLLPPPHVRPLTPVEGRGGCVCLALHKPRTPVKPLLFVTVHFQGDMKAKWTKMVHSPLNTSLESGQNLQPSTLSHWCLIPDLAPALCPALKKPQGKESRRQGQHLPLQGHAPGTWNFKIHHPNYCACFQACVGLLPRSTC